MIIFLPGKQMTLYTSCGLCLISRVAEPVCFFTLLMSQAKERVCRAPGPGYEWVEVSVARGSERQYSLSVSG